MKYTMLILLAALAITACNNETKNQEAATETTAVESPAAEPIAAGPKDPVCDMVKEAGWTEYTVNGTDTVWFCSETCKTAYVGNPAKYSATHTH